MRCIGLSNGHVTIQGACEMLPDACVRPAVSLITAGGPFTNGEPTIAQIITERFVMILFGFTRHPDGMLAHNRQLLLLQR
jgi:hypothetical protein